MWGADFYNLFAMLEVANKPVQTISTYAIHFLILETKFGDQGCRKLFKIEKYTVEKLIDWVHLDTKFLLEQNFFWAFLFSAASSLLYLIWDNDIFVEGFWF